MSKGRRLYLVDGSYYIFRAYYALRGLSNSKGFPTNALYGFVGMLKKLVDDASPEYLIVTFDKKGPTFRSEMYPEYKANRDAPPEDLVPQFPLFRDIVRGFNIPCIEEAGVEADDVLGTLAGKAAAEGFEVTIITGDKDLYQLVTDRVTLFEPMRERTVGIAEVEKRFQVAPSQVADVLGLMGDSSDNIPGVRGIGEKTAGKLIAKYGSVEGVMDNLADFKGKKMGEKLAQDREVAFLSRDLATIKVDLPIAFDKEAARFGDPDVPALSTLFRELEFTSHLDALAKKYGPLPEAEEEPQSEAEQLNWSIIDSPLALERAVEGMRKAKTVAVDVLASPGGPMHAEIVGLGLAWQKRRAAYVPIGHDVLKHPKQLMQEYVLETLRPILEDPSISKVGLHAKQDWVLLKRNGVEVRGVAFDVMLASYILDASRKSHALETLTWDYLRRKTPTAADLLGTGARRKAFSDLGCAEAAEFASEEAESTLQLSADLAEKLDEESLRSLHDDLELPLGIVLGRMETHGVLIDSQRLEALSNEFAERVVAIKDEIYREVGFEFNVGSPKQLAEVLFEKLKLPVVKRTKTGPSTDQTVLDQLSDKHPVPALIVEYRGLSKLKSTYTDTLPTLVSPETGRIHTEFNQTVAATGRLSSNNPNLQNIPVRSAEGKRIREAFVAPPGACLFSADYSQIELRLLAHMSGSPVLVDAFTRGQDIHARTAAELFDVPTDEISKRQRSIAKTINFGILYGMGPVRLARELKISRTEAKEFIQRYFERIGEVHGFLEELVEQAVELGYAQTILGRRRPLPELKSRNRGVRALGERLAVNTPMQGSAADLIKVAMVNIQRKLDESTLDAHMLLQVHDELIFEVAEKQLADLRSLVVQEMESAVQLDVPPLVSVSSGLTWAAL